MQASLLPHRIAAGPWQMGADHVLLDLVDENPGQGAIVRTYEWSEPTLSLGYFQSYREVEADDRWNGQPVIRRPSGGGALWHHHEITYAVVVPRFHPFARHPSDLYRAIHEGLAHWLRDRGWPAQRRCQAEASDTARKPAFRPSAARPFLCFQDHDPEDVVIEGVKVIGSAQRRRPNSVVQHGSVLLSRSDITPELPGLLDFPPAEGEFERTSLIAELPIILAAVLGLDPVGSTPWTDELVAGIEHRAQSQFAQSQWTRKR